MIKPDIIERVRQETDIVALIGSYVPLKKVGRYYRGLCPFHSERSPSFYVSPERQAYHCFGCGAGGTAITFVMRYEKLEFPEAVRLLAKRLGIRVEEETGSSKYQPLYETCERVARFYEQMLVKSEPARNYLQQRGLSANTIKRFRLGFAPGGNYLRGHAAKLGLNEELLIQSGLLLVRDEGRIDYFRERIIFPVFSLSGRIIGFGGRVLDDSEPKYLNSPDTPIFHKGENLYGLYQARAYIRDNVPVLVEGNFDLLSLVEHGINNCLASLGTALTTEQALLLRRFNQQVILCYDGDEAGRKACRRSIETLLRAGLDPQIVNLPADEDPDSFVRKYGREDFENILSRRVDFVDFIVAGRELSSVAEQRAVLRELTGLVALIPDSVTGELYRNRIARNFNIDPRQLLTAGPENSKGTDFRLSDAWHRRAEKLLAAAVKSQRLAQVASEFSISELVEDEVLSSIARTLEVHCGDEAYSPHRLMELVGDDTARNKIARWLFSEEKPPDENDFRRWLCDFRGRWLQREIERAHDAGDQEREERLIREKNLLKSRCLKKK
ncbi:MAG: DNA primase [candidate division WOR-3 bacterium]